MINKLKILYSKLDVHTSEVLRKSAASTIVKVAGMAIGLFVSIFIGRNIGAEGLGIINLSNKIVQVFLMVALYGMPQVITKEVSIAHKKKKYKKIGNILYSSYIINGGAALIISFLLILISPWLAENIFNEARLKWPLIIAFIVMIPQTFSRIFSSAVIGYRKIWQSSLVDKALSMLTAGVILLIVWWNNITITIIVVAYCYAIGRIVVFITIGTYWNKLYYKKSKPRFIGKDLLKTSTPLFYVAVISAILMSSDTIILGWLSDSKQVGLYSVASRIALLTSLFLQVTNSAISPKIAQLYEDGDSRKLEKMVQQTTRVLFFIGLISFILFVGLGKTILSLWGDEFVSAFWVLIVLSFGQFVNISTGASGMLLIMCGFEKTRRNIAYFSLILNLCLNLIFIYYFGALGAAIAISATLITDNYLKVYYAKKLVNVSTIRIMTH